MPLFSMRRALEESLTFWRAGRTLVVYTPDGDGVRLLHVALITEIETSEAA